MILNSGKRKWFLEKIRSPYGMISPFLTTSEITEYCSPQKFSNGLAIAYDHSNCWHTLHDPSYRYHNNKTLAAKNYGNEILLTLSFLMITLPWAIGLWNLFYQLSNR